MIWVIFSEVLCIQSAKIFEGLKKPERSCPGVSLCAVQEYMDPMNEHNALNEARQMIAVADENQNHSLELDEILKYSEYFTGSKLMDYARNVHEEFWRPTRPPPSHPTSASGTSWRGWPQPNDRMI